MASALLKVLDFSHLLYYHSTLLSKSTSELELTPVITAKVLLAECKSDRITLRLSRLILLRLSLSTLRAFPAPCLTACRSPNSVTRQGVGCVCSCISILSPPIAPSSQYILAYSGIVELKSLNTSCFFFGWCFLHPGVLPLWLPWNHLLFHTLPDTSDHKSFSSLSLSYFCVITYFPCSTYNNTVCCLFVCFGLLACRILIAPSGIKPEPLELEAWRLNHWTIQEVPCMSFSMQLTPQVTQNLPVGRTVQITFHKQTGHLFCYMHCALAQATKTNRFLTPSFWNLWTNELDNSNIEKELIAS